MSLVDRPETRFIATSSGRADVVVATELAPISRRELRDLFADRLVRIDGKLARKGDPVAAGQAIDIATHPSSRRPIANQLDIEVLFVDDDLVAIDKPSAIATHPLARGETDTAANWLVQSYPETDGIGDDEREAGWVHRLDRGTSGVLLAARSRQMWLAMREAFRDGKIEKRYLAVVDGVCSDGESNAPLARRGKRTVAASAGDPDAQEAVTRWRLKESFGGKSLLEVELVTGRTHQIRAHLAISGTPICGDVLYGGSPTDGHQFLHASRLAFPHPRTRAAVEITCPLPSDRAALLAELRVNAEKTR